MLIWGVDVRVAFGARTRGILAYGVVLFRHLFIGIMVDAPLEEEAWDETE